jgi:SAM-dependent methyltransferase
MMSWLRRRLGGRSDAPAAAVAAGLEAADGAPETKIARWPFWAPTPDASVELALDMAGIKPGERLLDLGCGDGRVLEAAVRRGATALGYEADALRAAMARERLAPLNGAAQVEVADFHTAPLQADVVFAFLSPATLFRLRNRFAALPAGTRIVTYGYGFVGWASDKHTEGCFLYTLPPRLNGSAFHEGWSAGGLVVGGPPDRTVLVAFPFGARGGKVEVEVSSELPSFSEVYLGAQACDFDTNIPVDIKVTTGAAGSLLTGGIRIQGHDFLVVVVATGDHMVRRSVKRQDVDTLRRELLEVQAGNLEPTALLAEPDAETV